MLNRLHLLIVLWNDVHDVVQDHEIANVEDEVDHAQDDTDDQTTEVTTRIVTVTSEVRDNLENNLNHQHHDVEDDVGVNEALPVLPDSVNAEGEEDQPDDFEDEGHDEDYDDLVELSIEEGSKIDDERQAVTKKDQVPDHQK